MTHSSSTLYCSIASHHSNPPLDRNYTLISGVSRPSPLQPRASDRSHNGGRRLCEYATKWRAWVSNLIGKQAEISRESRTDQEGNMGPLDFDLISCSMLLTHFNRPAAHNTSRIYISRGLLHDKFHSIAFLRRRFSFRRPLDEP